MHLQFGPLVHIWNGTTYRYSENPFSYTIPICLQNSVNFGSAVTEEQAPFSDTLQLHTKDIIKV